MSKALSSLAALRAAATAGQGVSAVAPAVAPAPIAQEPERRPVMDDRSLESPFDPRHEADLPRDPAPPALVTNQRRRNSPVAPSREGLVAVTVHMRPEGRRVLKQLAAETDKTVDELGRMAFNMLLTHYQKPRLV